MSAAWRLVLSIGMLAAAARVSLDAPPATAVGKDSPAAAAGLRVGDVVLRYNGVSVADIRQFYALMLDSAPGTTVHLELLREGKMHRVDVPVEQIDTALRA